MEDSLDLLEEAWEEGEVEAPWEEVEEQQGQRLEQERPEEWRGRE